MTLRGAAFIAGLPSISSTVERSKADQDSEIDCLKTAPTRLWGVLACRCRRSDANWLRCINHAAQRADAATAFDGTQLLLLLLLTNSSSSFSIKHSAAAHAAAAAAGMLEESGNIFALDEIVYGQPSGMDTNFFFIE